MAARFSRDLSLQAAAREYTWLLDSRAGVTDREIARRERSTIGRVRFGRQRAARIDASPSSPADRAEQKAARRLVPPVLRGLLPFRELHAELALPAPRADRRGQPVDLHDLSQPVGLDRSGARLNDSMWNGLFALVGGVSTLYITGFFKSKDKQLDVELLKTQLSLLVAQQRLDSTKVDETKEAVAAVAVNTKANGEATKEVHGLLNSQLAAWKEEIRQSTELAIKLAVAEAIARGRQMERDAVAAAGPAPGPPAAGPDDILTRTLRYAGTGPPPAEE